jgi:hypothetical protein
VTTKTEAIRAARNAAWERFKHDDAALAEALAEANKLAMKFAKKNDRAGFYKALERRPDLQAAVVRDVANQLIDEAVNNGELKRPN